jgi:multidrug resistance protein, MATE family
MAFKIEEERILTDIGQNLAENNLTGVDIWTAVRMALPLVGTSMMFCLIGVVDMAVAGWQGTASQAAVGIADQCIFATMLIGTGLAAATGCFVSQAIGARNFEVARRYALDGLALAVLFGVMSSIVCYFAADAVIRIFECSQTTRILAVPYLQVCAVGNLPFMIVIVQGAIMRAMGRNAQCLRMWLIIGFTSIAGGVAMYLCPALPTYKALTSLAVAWDLGALIGMAATFRVIKNQLFNNKIQERGAAPVLTRIREFTKVGMPVMLSEACAIGSLVATYAILGRLPGSDNLQAAYTVTLKIEETFGILPLVALSAVSATLVGHHVGAGLLTRAKTLGWHLCFVGTAVMVCAGAFVQNASPALARLFSEIDTVISEVGIGTASATISFPMIAFAFILFASLEGAGKTELPLAAQLIGYIVLRLPLAYLFALGLGLNYFGVWLAIIISRIAMAMMAGFTFRRVDLSAKVHLDTFVCM